MKTKIAWTMWVDWDGRLHEGWSWNPWRGCTKVSTGCANCYAERIVAGRLKEGWGKGAKRTTAKMNTLLAPTKWNTEMLEYRKKGYLRERGKVFSLSLGDWLDGEVGPDVRVLLLTMVQTLCNLDWLLCTKRPALFYNCMEEILLAKVGTEELRSWIEDWLNGNPPENVVSIVTTENQQTMDERLEPMLAIPAKIRALSCEPMLEKIDVSAALDTKQIHWVITGGESSNGIGNPRPCPIAAFVEIADACRDRNIPYFMKQAGKVVSNEQGKYYYAKDRSGMDFYAVPFFARRRERPWDVEFCRKPYFKAIKQ